MKEWSKLNQDWIAFWLLVPTMSAANVSMSYGKSVMVCAAWLAFVKTLTHFTIKKCAPTASPTS